VWAGDEMEAAPSRLITLVIGELLRVLREMASATFASRSWSHRTMLLRACSLAYRRPNLIDISARWGHRLREFSASFSLSQLCSSDRRDSRTHTLGRWIIPAPYSVRMVQAGASSTAISFSFGTNGMMAVEDERMRNNYASLSAHILSFSFPIANASSKAGPPIQQLRRQSIHTIFMAGPRISGLDGLDRL
jgi:hypothetical protein